MKRLLACALLATLSFHSFAEEFLSDSIPYPFYTKQTNGQNEVMSIKDGRAALQLRLEMIRRAKKSVEVEYFIFNTDMAGKLIVHELIKAAERGVKVRILVDKSVAVFEFDEDYANALAKKGIEVRYYNNASVIRVSSVQFRSHRKLISVDDSEAITGGRNIGDDYFELSPKFNFNDTDIYVRGSIVKTIRESFDKYFEHKIAERVKPVEFKSDDLNRVAAHEKKLKEVQKFLEISEEETAILTSLETSAKKKLDSLKLHTCPETTYATDAPGSTFLRRIEGGYVDKYKFLRKALYDKISRIDKSILISSPYLIANDKSDDLMKDLLKRKIDITLYTNSLASTDAVYVASNLYFTVYKWVDKGINVYLHDGEYMGDNNDLDPKIHDARWGTHSKVQVYEYSDATEAMIGTYNMDNRSNFYNSEMAVFCKGNDEFTTEVKNGILNDIKHGIQINKDGSATDRHGTQKSVFGSSEKDVQLMRFIFLPAWLLKFLL